MDWTAEQMQKIEEIKKRPNRKPPVDRRDMKVLFRRQDAINLLIDAGFTQVELVKIFGLAKETVAAYRGSKCQ